MKNVDTFLKQSINKQTTSICTCWKVTRKDGVTFYFTDASSDVIVYEKVSPSSVQVNKYKYISALGYKRTAISSTDNASVDNLDFEGVFIDEFILKKDIKKGLYDFADVEIFIIDLFQSYPKEHLTRLRDNYFVGGGRFDFFKTLKSPYNDLNITTYFYGKSYIIVDTPTSLKRGQIIDINGNKYTVKVCSDNIIYFNEILEPLLSTENLKGIIVPTCLPYNIDGKRYWATEIIFDVDTINVPFVVNEDSTYYTKADITTKKLVIKKGKLGEVVTTTNDGYKTELRGATQLLNNYFSDVYSSTCRARFGDSFCKMPVDVTQLSKGLQCVKGKLYNIYMSQVQVFNLLSNDLTNENSLNDWGVLVSNNTSNNTFLQFKNLFIFDDKHLYPPGKNSALKYLMLNRPLNGGIYNRLSNYTLLKNIDVTSQQLTDCSINFKITLNATSIYKIYNGSEKLSIILLLKDNSNNVIKSITYEDVLDYNFYLKTTLNKDIDTINSDWALIDIDKDVAVPSNTTITNIDVILSCSSTSSKIDCSIAVCNFNCSLSKNASNTILSSSYNFVLLCTTSAGVISNDQYLYFNEDLLIGDSLPKSYVIKDSNNNDIIFSIVHSLQKTATITSFNNISSSDSQQDFNITFDSYGDTTTYSPDDGVFDYGLLTFLSGDNKGNSMDIHKQYKGQNGTRIVLYLPMTGLIDIGDRITIIPGCDKELSTCIFKYGNKKNFRGEPFVPGQDKLFDYPSSPGTSTSTSSGTTSTLNNGLGTSCDCSDSNLNAIALAAKNNMSSGGTASSNALPYSDDYTSSYMIKCWSYSNPSPTSTSGILYPTFSNSTEFTTF